MPSGNRGSRSRPRRSKKHLSVVNVFTLDDLIRKTCQLHPGKFFRLPIFKTSTSENVRGTCTGWYNSSCRRICFFAESKRGDASALCMKEEDMLPLGGMRMLLRNDLLDAGWRKVGDTRIRL